MPQGRFFESLPEEKTFYESHRRHLDIHVVIKGEERMDISSLDDLQVDEEKSDLEKGDFFVFTGEPDEKQTVILKPSKFLVVFSEDVHRCKGQVKGPCDVEKIVFKIKNMINKYKDIHDKCQICLPGKSGIYRNYEAKILFSSLIPTKNRSSWTARIRQKLFF